MAGNADCKYYEDCLWLHNVGSCLDECYLFKDKHEKRVVLCTECRYQDGCARSTLYLKHPKETDAIKFYESHPLEYCSRGKFKEE